ncbi:MAG: hypothetical protein JNM90_25265 [Burkholderiales bacterium]|nr:hypothetical protein [Burkholderiales bacterium]
MIGAAGPPDESAPLPGAAARRQLLQRVRADCDRLRALPPAEQGRRYAAARAASPTLFALLQRLRQDAAARGLIDAAVLRTRAAPTDAELARAVAHGFAGAFRAGRHAFADAARSVLARLTEEFGADNAARVRLPALQRAYLAGAARARAGSFDAVAAVMAIASIEALRVDASGAVAVGGAAPAADDQRPAAQPLPGEEVLATFLLAACRHVEGGLRNGRELADALAFDLGEPARALARDCYEAIRHCPGIEAAPSRDPGADAFRLAA